MLYYQNFDIIRVQHNQNNMSNNPNIPYGFDENGDYTGGLPAVHEIKEEVDTEPFKQKITLSSHPLFNTPDQCRINK